MSSRKVGGRPSSGGPVSSSPKGKNTSEALNHEIEQLSHDVNDVSLDSAQDDGWEVYTKKSKNKAGSSAPKQWASQNSNPRAWGHSDVVQKLGMRSSGGSGRGAGNNWPTLPADSRRPSARGNGKPQSFNQTSDGNQVTSAPAVPPPLKHGWNWSARTGSTQPLEEGSEKNLNVQNPDLVGKENAKTSEVVDDDDYYESDTADEYDDDILSDDFDSDTSVKSHDARKKNRWFNELFECMDSLTVEQINDTERQWHCPACKGGPGAIDWFRGLQPLIAHAKTKGATRVKLHRELAQLLEEELHRRGTSAVPAGEMFGKWEGLDERTEKEIVWPPMVVIMNTRHEKDENDKWMGMGNQELLDYFSSYAAVKARHSYGPQGHRGMSLLIFEASAVGYLEAERLSKHFEDNGRDRDSWERKRVPFYPGGKRQLYGFMAEKRDLDSFNYHCQGKSKLKFEVRSYQEMVVRQLKQMSEDNQQLLWFKNRVAKEQRHSKALEASFGLVSEKLRKMQEENRIVRLRTKKHHEQNKEEMDYQEQFFKEQIKVIYEARDAKEDDFEKIQQEQREKITQQSHANPSSAEDPRVMAEAIAKSIKLQDKEMEEFVSQREKLMKSHEERMSEMKSRHLQEELALKRRHWEEEVAVEEEFNIEESKLMEKYMPAELRAGQ
nr:protein SUPPRESSOR OF GENE SILENCING 3-like [Coffea arabica]